MASVIHRTTLEYRTSVNTPDFPTNTWIINPDLSAVQNVPIKYWKCVGDAILEMSQSEKDEVDAEEEEILSAKRNGFVLNYVFYDNNKSYISATSDTYKVVAVFIWPGSSIVGEPKQINLIAKQAHSSGGNILLYDSTNNITLASSNIDNEELDMLFLTTLQELPVSKAVLEIHIRRVDLYYVSFEF